MRERARARRLDSERSRCCPAAETDSACSRAAGGDTRRYVRGTRAIWLPTRPDPKPTHQERGGGRDVHTPRNAAHRRTTDTIAEECRLGSAGTPRASRDENLKGLTPDLANIILRKQVARFEQLKRERKATRTQSAAGSRKAERADAYDPARSGHTADGTAETA